MAIAYKTTRYGCEFKCGTRRRSNIEKAEMHEDICWKNPKNRTCKSCKHEIYEAAGCSHDEMPGCPDEAWMIRGCNVKEGEEFIQEVYESLKSKNGYHIMPLVNCVLWEAK
jgi:hypothetical protein